MKRRVAFTNYCPAKEKEMRIDISYLDATCREDLVPVYIKGKNLCPWADQCGKCLIWENAPQSIHLSR